MCDEGDGNPHLLIEHPGFKVNEPKECVKKLGIVLRRYSESYRLFFVQINYPYHLLIST